MIERLNKTWFLLLFIVFTITGCLSVGALDADVSAASYSLITAVNLASSLSRSVVGEAKFFSNRIFPRRLWAMASDSDDISGLNVSNIEIALLTDVSRLPKSLLISEAYSINPIAVFTSPCSKELIG